MKNILGILLLVVTLSSCFTEQVDLDLNQGDPKLIITGWITDSPEPQYVSVSQSINYLGEQNIDYVSGATLTLSDGNNTYSLEEKENGRYYLPSNWTAVYGQIYTLEINYNGVSYTSTQLMRKAPAIEEIAFREVGNDSDSLDLYEVYLSWLDSIGEGDGYFILDHNKGKLVDNWVDRGDYGDDDLVDGEYFENIVVTNFDYRYELGDTVVVELYNIGADAVKYLTEIAEESFRGDSPFESPPVNVSTNISGEAFGYFMISGMQKEVIIIE